MKFHLKSYGLQELAVLYFPNSTPSSASTQLKKWITKSLHLQTKLEKSDYRSGQKILTPKQVSILVDHLGEPWEEKTNAATFTGGGIPTKYYYEKKPRAGQRIRTAYVCLD